jgi:hypothetical protein
MSIGRTPDGVEPIIGWRAWSIVRDQTRATYGLGPLHWRRPDASDWPPLRPAIARCNRRSTEGVHEPPSKSCTCGLYALSEVSDVLRYSRTNRASYGVVLGTVSLWGRVIVAEHGFRAEHGYPRTLTVLTEDFEPSCVVMDSLRAYRVPLSACRWADFGWAIGELCTAIRDDQDLAASCQSL